MSAPSARFFDEYATRIGAVITGRRTYDIVDGWGAGPLPGVPLFASPPRTRAVEAHPSIHLRHDGIESAVDTGQAAAGERT